jgi:hypothetical protein
MLLDLFFEGMAENRRTPVTQERDLQAQARSMQIGQ